MLRNARQLLASAVIHKAMDNKFRKNNLIFVLFYFIISFTFTSCDFYNKIMRCHKNVDKTGHTPCFFFPKTPNMHLEIWKDLALNKIKLKNGDTVASIGVGSGWREFMLSTYTDSITFYMEELDTSCISKERIKNILLPNYSEIRGSIITNNFIPTIGTPTTIGINNNKVDKVLILFDTYHHLSDDIAIIKECNRILKANGKFIVDEYVTRKNKFAYPFFCPIVGGYFKSEKNFIKDIVDNGFKCDTVYRERRHMRIFVFSKL